jgi:hypothetical protein
MVFFLRQVLVWGDSLVGREDFDWRKDTDVAVYYLFIFVEFQNPFRVGRVGHIGKYRANLRFDFIWIVFKQMKDAIYDAFSIQNFLNILYIASYNVSHDPACLSF